MVPAGRPASLRPAAEFSEDVFLGAGQAEYPARRRMWTGDFMRPLAHWRKSPVAAKRETMNRLILFRHGKAERGAVAIDAIRDSKAVYLMAVGGAAYLVSKAIKSARVLAFADLGMEAIYEFDVQDMPVTVAVDAGGTSVHITGPREWQAKIGKIPVAVV